MNTRLVPGRLSKLDAHLLVLRFAKNSFNRGPNRRLLKRRAAEKIFEYQVEGKSDKIRSRRSVVGEH